VADKEWKLEAMVDKEVRFFQWLIGNLSFLWLIRNFPKG
jgi:hypothetical protein